MNLGILLMILVAVFQAVMSAIAKGIAPHSTTGVEVLSYYGIPLLVLLPGVFASKQEYKTNRLGFYFFRGVFASGSVFCFFYASKMISLSAAALLFNLTPVFIPLFARLFLGEVTSKAVLIGILISLIGVVIVIHPGVHTFMKPASLIGLGSGILMAMAQVMLRHLAKIKEPVKKIVFYIYFTSTLFSLLIILIESVIRHRDLLSIHIGLHGTWVILLLLSLGLISLVAQHTLTKAFHYMSAAKLAPLLYISVPVSSLIGWVIWRQALTLNLLLGGILILIGVLFITFEKNKELK